MRYVLNVVTALGLIFCSMAYAENASTAAPAPKADKKIEEYVTLKTNKGTMVIKLYSEKAPLTVKNFLSYVDSGFYDGTIVHRIVPGFVIQGGGYDQKFQRKPTSRPIRNESDNQVKNLRGTLSMARTGNPHSATTQFFINIDDNPDLDWRPGKPGYAVFGEIVEGINVVDAIARLERGKYGGALREAPNEMVVIEQAHRSSKPKAKAKKQ